MIRWCTNLTMLFREVPFLERFQAAAEAGFAAVEFSWPSGVDLDALVAAKEAARVEVALFNIDTGDVASGDRGFANDPAKRDWWRERTEVALVLARRLNAHRINALAGNEVLGLSRAEMLDCLCENLTWAIPKAAAAGVTLLLEPLNHFESPRYLLNRTIEAVEVIERLNSPQVKLQFDVYHAQRTEGNLTRLLQTYIERIGHIQIADSPDRHQPGTGEINWRFVLSQLEAYDYPGSVGLEYIPVPATLDSLAWLPFDKRRACSAHHLRLF
jgi:hydroxypyruvate isomerase